MESEHFCTARVLDQGYMQRRWMDLTGKAQDAKNQNAKLRLSYPRRGKGALSKNKRTGRRKLCTILRNSSADGIDRCDSLLPLVPRCTRHRRTAVEQGKPEQLLGRTLNRVERSKRKKKKKLADICPANNLQGRHHQNQCRRQDPISNVVSSVILDGVERDVDG